jgi:hypothetical protein
VPAGDRVEGQGEQQQQQQPPTAGSSSDLQPPQPPADGGAAAAVLEPDSTNGMQEHGDNSAGATAAAAGTSDRGVPASRLQQRQQQEQCFGEEEYAFQAQQLLLVGSKVTGDRNVPAGQVTFAVDLGSRSREGAGHLLQLPPGVHTAVEVNGPGTRPLVVKVWASMCPLCMLFCTSRACSCAEGFFPWCVVAVAP